jgi:hypothetical protein
VPKAGLVDESGTAQRMTTVPHGLVRTLHCTIPLPVNFRGYCLKDLVGETRSFLSLSAA